MATVTVIKTCSVCGIKNEDVKTCARCKIVNYCSRKCQKRDWPLHKHHCKSPLEILSETIWKCMVSEVEKYTQMPLVSLRCIPHGSALSKGEPVAVMGIVIDILEPLERQGVIMLDEDGYSCSVLFRPIMNRLLWILTPPPFPWDHLTIGSVIKIDNAFFCKSTDNDIYIRVEKSKDFSHINFLTGKPYGLSKCSKCDEWYY